MTLILVLPTKINRFLSVVWLHLKSTMWKLSLLPDNFKSLVAFRSSQKIQIINEWMQFVRVLPMQFVMLHVTWPVLTWAISTIHAFGNFVMIPSFPARLQARCICLAGWAGISPEGVLTWIIQQLVGKTILLGSAIDLTLKQCQHYSLDLDDWSCGESFIYELLLLILSQAENGLENKICEGGLSLTICHY